MSVEADQGSRLIPEQNQVDEQSPPKKPPYIGHTLDEARKLAAQQGYALRVMRMDGENLLGTTEVVPNRIDIAVENGIIVPR